MGFTVGKGSCIHLGCHFNIKGGLLMGSNSTINMNCHIDTRGGVEIGNNVSISPYVSLVTADHDLNDPSFSGREGKIILEDFVFVGYRAIVLKGVTMKKGSVLGAGSVLAKDAAGMGIYMGMPAQLVKQRNTGLDYTVRYDRLFH